MLFSENGISHFILESVKYLITCCGSVSSSTCKALEGGFLYLKNLTGSSNIYIGYGSNAALQADDNTTRLLTLKPGEFTWLPWDLTADLIVDASDAGTDALEAWYFDRG